MKALDPPKQAGNTAETLAEAMSGAELATTADIATVRSEIAEVKAEISALGTELNEEIAALRVEVKAEIAALRTEFELLQGDLTIRLGSMMIAMRDVGVKTLAGVVLGHRHITVGAQAVGAMAPRRSSQSTCWSAPAPRAGSRRSRGSAPVQI